LNNVTDYADSRLNVNIYSLSFLKFAMKALGELARNGHRTFAQIGAAVSIT